MSNSDALPLPGTTSIRLAAVPTAGTAKTAIPKVSRMNLKSYGYMRIARSVRADELTASMNHITRYAQRQGLELEEIYFEDSRGICAGELERFLAQNEA